MGKIWFVFFACVVFFMWGVSARVDVINNSKEVYYLGEDISGSLAITRESDLSALLMVYLACGNKTFTFYAMPVVVKTGELKEISLPSFPVYGGLLGECVIRAEIKGFDGSLIEENEGSVFRISDYLEADISAEKEYVEQGGSLAYSVALKKEGSYNISAVFEKEDVKIGFFKNFSRDLFLFNFSLPKNIKRGEGAVTIIVFDKNGNNIKEIFDVGIRAVIANLSSRVEGEKFKPKEKVTITAELLDYSGERVEDNISVVLKNPEGKAIENFWIGSGKSKEIYLQAYSVPGYYNLSVKKGELESNVAFEVSVVQDIIVSVENGFLVLGNEGNVKQKSENVLNASSSGKVYSIPLSVDIKPGEKQRFGLEENLPEGKYELRIGLGNISHVLKEVYVEDDRPLPKKISQGLNSITGKAVINTEDKSNFFVFVIAIVFASLIVFFVVRNKLKAGFVIRTGGLEDAHERVVGGLKMSLDKERKLKKEMQELFEKYVGKEVLEFSKKNKYGMEKKEIAVLFTDMRGFSKLFDSLDALEVIKILNMYFKSTNEIIRINGGFINKFVGDSVMALFNAPKDEREFVLRAVRSGIKIRGEIARVNARLKKQGLNEIEVGIGIDVGKAAVGVLGSREKSEYTAIGVPVNVAFRLQSEGTGSQVLVSEKIYELLKERIDVEYVGEMNFRNISKPVKVYNVLGFKV